MSTPRRTNGGPEPPRSSGEAGGGSAAGALGDAGSIGMTGTQLARHTAVMSAGTLLSRATGFLRVAALSYAFGVTEGKLADAYNLANTAPNIIYELVLGGVLSSMLVPVFVETLRRDRDEHRHVVNTITTLSALLLVVVSLVAIAAAPLIARLLTLRAETAPGDVVAMRAAVTLFLQLFMPQVVFYGLAALWTAYLNAHGHFAAPMFSPVLNNLLVSAVVVGFGALVHFEAVDLRTIATSQLLLLAVGTTLGVVVMTLPLWPVARRNDWSWRPSFDWRHPMVQRVGRLGWWVVLYVGTNQLTLFFIVLLAGAIPLDGAFAAYTYAFVFFQLPHGIYAVSVMTALLPTLSAAASEGDMVAFRRHLLRGVRATALLIVPAAVGLAVLSTPIVRLLLEKGVFTPRSTELVSRTLVAYLVGLVPFSLHQLFLRAYYALQDTRTPVVVNIVANVVNTVIDVVLFIVLPLEWKVPGLALGHASCYVVGAALFAYRLRHDVGRMRWRETIDQLVRISAASVLMGALAWGTARGISSALGTGLVGQATSVTGAVAVGAAGYLAFARLFGVQELETVTRLVRRWSAAR